MVVQWKLPDKLSSFVQRAGRVARGPNTTGLAVLLVEPRAYSVATTDPPPVITRDRNTQTRQSKTRKKTQAGSTKKTMQEYARAHGRFRGGRNPAQDTIARSTPPVFHSQDPTKGLYLFVQATMCRCALLRDMFDNAEPARSCCYLTSLILTNVLVNSYSQKQLSLAVTSVNPHCWIAHGQESRSGAMQEMRARLLLDAQASS